MAYTPPEVPPDFKKLKGVISASQTAIKDRALVQVLYGLLDQLGKFQGITEADTAKISSAIEEINNAIGGGGSGGGLINGTYLTTEVEIASLPYSVQLLAGAGITFDDTVPNERTISSSGGGSGDHPVGTVYETWVNINAGTLLGVGTWLLMATGVRSPTNDITFTVY